MFSKRWPANRPADVDQAEIDMVTNSKSIENLQKALSMELSAVHQYLLHAHVLDDWGLDRLAVKMREEMQEEMGHAGGKIHPDRFQSFQNGLSHSCLPPHESHRAMR